MELDHGYIERNFACGAIDRRSVHASDSCHGTAPGERNEFALFSATARAGITAAQPVGAATLAAIDKKGVVRHGLGLQNNRDMRREHAAIGMEERGRPAGGPCRVVRAGRPDDLDQMGQTAGDTAMAVGHQAAMGV